MIKFSSKDIMVLEKWANGLSKLAYLDPLLVRSAQNTVRSLKEDLKGDSMSKDVDELNKMAQKPVFYSGIECQKRGIMD